MKYPSVSQVAHYLDNRDEYEKQRLSKANWVHNKNFVRRILQGDYFSILPFHVEVCSTYLCNFKCPWCSCRNSMLKDIPHHTMTKDELYKIIDKCSKHQIGIQWTGGEPLINTSMCDAIEYADNKGLLQCLFTNGSLLSERVQLVILRSNLQFIRISLNCANIRGHSVFHGNIDECLSKKVVNNITDLCRNKIKYKSTLMIGLSLVVGDTNKDLFVETLQYIYRLLLLYPNTINYIVVRQVNTDLVDKTVCQEQVGLNDDLDLSEVFELINLIQNLGTNIVFPFEDVERKNITCETTLACSFFSEISPDGDVYMCSDQYGNKEYKIGNLYLDNWDDIWNSERRLKMVEKHRNCMLNGNCPRYSRGQYMNTLVEQIESFRKRGEIERVENWINDLIAVLPKEKHSFFI